MSNQNIALATSLKPLAERRSAGQDVYDILRRNITNGDIPAGSRVVELHIAAIMGVSRTPVREAIHKLEREGLVTKKQRGGYIVTALTKKEIEESFGIRAVLEGYAAQLATKAHKPDELKPLLSKNEEFARLVHKGDLAALPKINTEIHEMLYALSQNQSLIKIINDYKDQFLRFRKIILSDKRLAFASFKDHSEMLEMMRRRKAQEVELLVREHVRRGLTAVLDQYDKSNSNG